MEIQFNCGIKLQEFSPLLVGEKLYPIKRYLLMIKISNNNFLLGFAAACTAGILLPLHLTIGIRLAKEDEIKGLDATGTLFYSTEIKDD